MKNRNENGVRKLEILLNPHSNGDIFSQLILVFFEIKIEIFIIIVDNKILNKKKFL